MSLSCPYGKITLTVLDGVGMTPKDGKVRDACIVDDEKFGNK